MNARITLSTGAILAALAVGLGAFGAHALKPLLLERNLLETYQTAVQYHFYHALGLLLLGILQQKNVAAGQLSLPAMLLLAGILFFSGSLYALCLSGVRILGAITPIGGVFFIVGWLLAALRLYQQKTEA